MKISDSEQLRKYLAELARVSVEDAINSDDAEGERTYQAGMEKRIVDTKPGDTEGTDEADDDALFKSDSEEQPEEDPKPELDIDDPSNSGDDTDGDGKFTPEDITVDAIIDKFNIIRAGHSMSDKSILAQMDEYIRSLDDPERIALYGFVKSIGQIVGSDVEAADVKEPEDEPYDVKMRRVNDLERDREAKAKSVDKDVDQADRAVMRKKKEEKPKKRAPGSEDTSAPIRAGYRPDESIRQAMKRSLID